MNLLKANKAGALARFRVMANVAGIMSLLLWLVYLPIKLTATNDNVPNAIRAIAVVHGFAYMVYILVTLTTATPCESPSKLRSFICLLGLSQLHLLSQIAGPLLNSQRSIISNE